MVRVALEELALQLLNRFSPVMFGSLRKYRGVEARVVAARMLQEATVDEDGVRIVEFD